MSHAQTPPPDHIFNPEIPGITWVDLVFPFSFLPWEQHFLFPSADMPKKEEVN